ncbi:MAG: phytanoyl-CoA dioxygenase family protein [Candidatus Poribacteria bacterium]|nr:phytanoyl-CoA dioxygenase family protein [Candidatus Poribacteria bacterium]
MQLTPEERQNSSLTPERLKFAIDQVRVNGYVILESVLTPDFVGELHETFMRTLNEYIRRTDSNRGKNRYQMHMPFMEPFNDARIITNTFALPILDALLGEDCVCHYFASDTPLPGSEHQNVHSDIHRLFPGMPISPPTFAAVVNVPLVDFTEENGPVEIWPGGTHLMPEDAPMRELTDVVDSKLCLMPAGSILVRDMRMWHRGTPNRSNAARPNMAMIYARYWLKTHYPKIGIPQDTYDKLSDRAKKLFRFEDIGGELVNVPVS